MGAAHRFPNAEPIMAYDIRKCYAILETDGMSAEEAEEYFQFNTLGAWVGEGTPIFIETVEE